MSDTTDILGKLAASAVFSMLPSVVQEAINSALESAARDSDALDAIAGVMQRNEEVFGAWSPDMTRHIAVAVLSDFADTARELPDGLYDDADSTMRDAVRQLLKAARP